MNPWLQDLPHLTFSENIASQYHIRSSQVAGGLSTLEAAAYSLQELEGCSVSPFIRALNGFTQTFTKKMPPAVKARYPKAL